MLRSPPITRAKGKKARDKSRSDDASLSSEASEAESSQPAPHHHSPRAMSLSQAQVRSMITECLTDDIMVDNLVTKLAAKLRSAVIDALAMSLSEAQQKIQSLNDQLVATKNEMDDMREQLVKKHDDLEQYTRRPNLRVYGVPESASENTDSLVTSLFKEKLKIDVPLERIERSHRVGPVPKGNKNNQVNPRPIIVRFQSYRDRQRVFSAKKNLKQTGVAIREDLTTTRLQVYKAAVEKYGLRSTWTLDGRILWVHQGRKGVATSLADLAECTVTPPVTTTRQQ